MRFEYDSSPFVGAAIGAGVIVIGSRLLPDTLLRLIGLSVAAGPAIWAFIQWRRRGHGVRFAEGELIIENPLAGRARCIPYLDILGSASTTDGGLIVAYLRRAQPSDKSDYPAISRMALAQARPPAGILRSIASTPRLKNIRECLALLSQHQEQNPSGLAQQLTEVKLQFLARRKNMRNILLFVLAVLATPIYVIVISRLATIFH